MANQLNSKLKYAEPILFYGVLFISLAYIAKGGYNPSLDGPAHMYNTRLIEYILSGNTYVRSFFAINKVPVPNVTDHILLMLFNTIFSIKVAVKILLAICVAGFAVAFRAIIALIRPENIGLSAFSIPFAHSFLFYLGFYNFCLSQVFLLWAIYYYLKNLNRPGIIYSVRKYICMLLLVTLTYFTNGLAFLILGIILLLFELKFVALIYTWKGKQKTVIKRIFLFISLWIPGLTCFIIFMVLIPTFNTNPYHKLSYIELIHNIINVRPLEVYDGNELVITRSFFLLISFLLLASLYFKIKQKAKKAEFATMLFLVMAALLLTCYLLVPDSASVGMASVRFCFYLFVFFVLWQVLQPNFNSVKWITLVAVYFLHLSLLIGKHQPIERRLNKVADEVADAGKYILPQSIVLPINVSDSWIMDHFIDYAGLEKPIINPNNYEAIVKWFPVVWNNKTVSNYSVNNNFVFDNVIEKGVCGPREIDYIFVLGDYSKITKEVYSSVKKIIDKKGRQEFVSDDGMIHLFSINHDKK